MPRWLRTAPKMPSIKCCVTNGTVISRVEVIRIRDNRNTVVFRFCFNRSSTLPSGERAQLLAENAIRYKRCYVSDIQTDGISLRYRKLIPGAALDTGKCPN